MRIPLPERFSTTQILVFASALLALQLAEGTNPIFAILCFAYVCAFCVSFNVAGGIFFPSGAFIFFNGLLGGVLGFTYKAVVTREPADSNLQAPELTMLVYAVSMAVLGVVAWVVRSIRPKRSLLSKLTVTSHLREAAIGCLLIGLFLEVSTRYARAESGSFASAFAQINYFIPISIMFATISEIRMSGGRRSTNWIVWLAGSVGFIVGLIDFSKEGIFRPFITWLVPVVVSRFNFTLKKTVVCCFLIWFSLYYLVPYAQYGRQSRTENRDAVIQGEAALNYLSDLSGTRNAYEAAVADQVEAGDSGGPSLFKSSQGLFDRLNMVGFDDALIQVTEVQGPSGLLIPVALQYANAVPHFLWADKPLYSPGNLYGHEVGVVADDDFTTGISFSPQADAFRAGGWVGTLVALPFVMFFLFYGADSFAGDIRLSPWGLLYISYFSHVAPEGLLNNSIWMTTYFPAGLTLIALLSRYVLPQIAQVLKGGGGRNAALDMPPVARPTLGAGPLHAPAVPADSPAL